AFVIDSADAYDVIAESAIPVAARPAGIRRQSAAESRLLCHGYIHRQLLSLAFQQCLQLGDGYARLNGDGHVSGRKINDLIQPAQIDADAGPRWRKSDVEHGSAAERINGLILGYSTANYLTQLRDRRGQDVRLGADVVDKAGF